MTQPTTKAERAELKRRAIERDGLAGDEVLRLLADVERLEKALRGVDPFNGGRDGDECLWCRRERPRDIEKWEDRLLPEHHDSDCELILALESDQ